MSNNCKVKGLLRGLRFISQIFDNEKEEEIQIGNPTDVKHVAHIGWQGPSESSPSWMNGFEPVPGLSSSAPLHVNGEIHSDGPDDSVKWVSKDSIRRGSRSVNSQGQERDLPDLPKSSRRQLMGNMRESHAKEKSDRPRQHKKPSKHSHQQKDHTTTCNVSKLTEETMATDDITDSLQLQGSDLQQPRTLTDNHRRSQSNRTRDGSNGGSGGSSGSRSRAKPRDLNLDQKHPSRSSSTTRNKQRSFEEEQDEPLQRRSSKQLVTN